MTIEIKPLPNAIGVEVLGLDLSEDIDSDTADRLYTAWQSAGIMLFRSIGTTPERQLNLSRVFGELEVHPIENIRLENYPELIWLANKDATSAPLYYYDDIPTVSRIPWHSDLVYTTTPNRGALLRMVDMPAQGGQTGWIDTAAAYDALDNKTKTLIEDKEGLFQFILNPCDMRFGRMNVKRDDNSNKASEANFYPDFPDIAHPLVWTHPETGKKSLAVSPLHLRSMVGNENAEADALLNKLVDHATSGEFTYIHQWQPNDMVLWDNWRTMHCALGHPPELKRMVHRTTIKGSHAFGRVLD
jgi:taurine dioxygenase